MPLFVSEYNIFLDDERLPPEYQGYILARSFEDFKYYIDEIGFPDKVSFDHDLGEEKTGLDCIKYLFKKLIECYEGNTFIPECTVHSMNPVGKKNIEDYYKWIVKYINNS